MRKILTAVAAAGLALSVTSASAEILIKFSHVTKETGHPKGEAAVLFAERVNSQMAGKVKVEVYPNSQLYNDNKVLEAMLLGDVQMAAPSLSKFEKYTKKFRIFDLPFMFKDIDVVDKFQQSEAGQDLLNSMRDNGLQGLSYWHNGMKQISANKPLLMPGDASGLKFRIQTSDVIQAYMEAVGANPQKMSFKEVYGALQTGVVDGQENTWSNIYTKKFFEVQDGVTESNHGIIDYLVVTSTEFWGNLPGDIRTELAGILADVSKERNAISFNINQENKAKVVASGSEVRQLTSDQRDAWVKAMMPVWDEFSGDIGSDLMDAAKASNM